MTKADTTLAKAYTAARTKSGLSQRELARRSGVSPTTIQRIEYQHRLPTGDKLNAIADVLGHHLQLKPNT